MKRYICSKKEIAAFIMLCISIIIALAIPVDCSAEQEKSSVIRVAYFNMGYYYQPQSDGMIKSYDTDVLSKVSEYSGLQFEFVDCGTWANALKMLENKEIDLVGTAQWNQEREEQYEFCLEQYGYTVGELAALESSGIVYEDYEAFGNAVIGCTENYVRLEELNNLFKEHNITPTMKYYKGQQELEDALENGEIDIIASNSHTMHADWKILEKFTYSPFYFISWKGNKELTDKIDNALIRENIEEPDTDDKMLREYFPEIIGAPLSKAELDLIAENNEYDLFYVSEGKPLIWFDTASEELKGAFVDACAQIKDITGLNIVIKHSDSNTNSESGTTVKFRTLFYDSYSFQKNQAGVTDALIDEPFNIYHVVGESIDLVNGKYTIGVAGNDPGMKNYVQEQYPNCKIKSFDSAEKCVKQLEAEKIDLAFVNVHAAENILTENAIDNVRRLPIDDVTLGFALEFSGENSELLKSIVNKGIMKTDQSQINDAMLQYALETHEKVTLNTIFRDHKEWIFTIIFFIVFILIVAAVLGTYGMVMRKQRNKIEKANKDRTEFFSRMSHDMRTPINGILGMLRLTRDIENLPAKAVENMDKAENAGQYMLSLINDTLDLQKLETKRLELNPEIVYARDYFEGIFSIIRVNAKKKNIEFRVTNINMDMDKYIEIDKVRVRQIFSNLLSNAIKFTPEGRTVEIIIECLGNKNDISRKKIQFIDTGVGMSKDFIENNLYKPYSQENNQMTSQQPGTGLGLAITKNLVEIMGGKLEVESEVGEGTKFTLYLDFVNVPDEVVRAEEEKKKTKVIKTQVSLQGKKILLCEDHPLNAEIAKRLLEKVGCKVICAENGEIGVKIMEDSEINSFDLILMDIKMPVMDGLEATRRIRALKREDAVKIPIIAMTANAYDSDKQNCYDAGMNAHLPKPVEPSVMYETIAQYL